MKNRREWSGPWVRPCVCNKRADPLKLRCYLCELGKQNLACVALILKGGMGIRHFSPINSQEEFGAIDFSSPRKPKAVL